ncbi:MAG: hypothetical protein CYG60_17115 [Actinobacteria bacterium]|nr:MAG: hypothetical protein CYG60_17115 [Actinomycetota bacterium]
MGKGKGSSGYSKSSKSSSGSKYRSAVSGRYVTSKHGKSHPKTTVKESPGARARKIKQQLRDEGKYFGDSTEIIRRDRESG